jgi:light-regulated signal transduction histidine kinase (bacteriophytochrome)
MRLAPRGTRPEMDSSDRNPTKGDIERLRSALDAETERRLQVQKQLDRANADFEEFISTATHNLRESLRAVASYSQLMADTYSGRLDSDADVFLGSIQDGVRSMQSLLTDIVEYWAADSLDRQPCRTDMEAALRQALLFADKQLKGSGAAVTHDPLPPVIGDFEILTKVLEHLIGNAIKFRGASHPRIHVSSKRADLETVFSVQDNGPGIDPAFLDRVFGVFKRLHGKEYAGTGLGLAFCKKAIERHGGRIWLESTPGAGATFYFTLPAAD